MRPWKNRSAKQRCFEYIAAIFLALSSVFYYPIAANKQPVAIIIFLFSGIIIFMLSIDITQKGKNKHYKEIFNTIWNFETAFVFCYGLISFTTHANNEATISNVLSSILNDHPWALLTGALILFITVMFRCSLNLAELLIKVKK
ncbi:TPA: hypothetical protein N5K87_000559 [Enterobacter asburiae]|uniref:hypothetical protein n=1 Tax=Enterobacter asburiae TaxID=61645 RepID=UPI001576EAA9|nr:hypothetical protein [Enterobacter asburiae]NQF31918.1 hypothetical protein [Enterobacter asburiae]HCM9117321.1 hypothetical protein [Enterobacter asburiae]